MLFGLRVVLLYSQEGIQDHHRDLKCIHVKIILSGRYWTQEISSNWKWHRSLVKEKLMLSWATLDFRTTDHKHTWDEVETIPLTWFKQQQNPHPRTHHRLWCPYNTSSSSPWLYHLRQVNSPPWTFSYCLFYQMGTITPSLQGCRDCTWEV